MTAQMDLELKHNERQRNFNNFAPRDWYKQKGQNGGGAPQQQQMQRGGFGSPQVHPQPMMIPQAQVQQPRQAMVAATVPGGSMMQVQNPYTGQMMAVQVPVGIMPGQQFAVMM